jgi:hypothetical protein
VSGLCLPRRMASHKLWHKGTTNKVARVVVLDVDGMLIDTNYPHVGA